MFWNHTIAPYDLAFVEGLNLFQQERATHPFKPKVPEWKQVFERENKTVMDFRGAFVWFSKDPDTTKTGASFPFLAKMILWRYFSSVSVRALW